MPNQRTIFLSFHLSLLLLFFYLCVFGCFLLFYVFWGFFSDEWLSSSSQSLMRNVSKLLQGVCEEHAESCENIFQLVL